MPVTVSGYSGKSALTNFPVLVRLSTAIPGFTYSDFRGVNGSDLRFADTNGVELAYEIDTWNPNGTSLVWVRIPVLVSNTVINAYYGNAAPAAALSATNVWTRYAGVWHLSELGGGGTSTDATINAINGRNDNCTTGMAGGVIGNCRRISDSSEYTANKGYAKAEGGILVPGYPALKIATNVTVSGWLLHKNQPPYADNVFYQRYSFNKDTTGGFAVQVSDISKGCGLDYTGSEIGTGNFGHAPLPGSYSSIWVHVSCVFDGANCYVYTNGYLSASKSCTPVRIATNWLSFGTSSIGGTHGVSWKGEMDELRIAPASFSAEWTAAEYESMAVTNFAVAGTVVMLDGVQIATGGGNTRIIPNAWITNNIDAATVAAGSAAISNALESAGANGVPRWQSYALGLDPNSATSVILGDARQDAAVAALTLFARNIAPVTNGTFTVRYVLEGSADGANWTDLGSSPSNALPIALPPAKPFFRVRAEIIQL